MFTEDASLPFFALVGSPQSPTWADTAVGFATFYHLVAKGARITDAVTAMRAASGLDEWWVTTAAEQREGFLSFVTRSDVGDAQRELAEDATTVAPDDLAKMTALEAGGHGTATTASN